MLTICIGVIAYVAISAAVRNAEIGAAILGIVILIVLILLAAGERKSARAFMNCRDWWADGGPKNEKPEHRVYHTVRNVRTVNVIVPDPIPMKQPVQARKEPERHRCPKCGAWTVRGTNVGICGGNPVKWESCTGCGWNRTW